MTPLEYGPPDVTGKILLVGALVGLAGGAVLGWFFAFLFLRERIRKSDDRANQLGDRFADEAKMQALCMKIAKGDVGWTERGPLDSEAIRSVRKLRSEFEELRAYKTLRSVRPK